MRSPGNWRSNGCATRVFDRAFPRAVLFTEIRMFSEIGMRSSICLMLILALAGGCGGGRLWEPSREEVLERILPAAVQIVIEQREGRRVRTGSGVAVAARRAGNRTECFVVTAGHAVSGLVGQNEVYVVFGGHRGNVKKTRADILSYKDTPELDLALLRTESDRCVPARMGGTALLGEPVWVVGFPWGRHMTLTRGIVSQVGLDDTTEREKAARLMVDAPVSYGSSGGGVFEESGGQVIGADAG